jgi:hypothetical protein
MFWRLMGSPAVDVEEDAVAEIAVDGHMALSLAGWSRSRLGRKVFSTGMRATSPCRHDRHVDPARLADFADQFEVGLAHLAPACPCGSRRCEHGVLVGQQGLGLGVLFLDGDWSSTCCCS